MMMEEQIAYFSLPQCGDRIVHPAQYFFFVI